MALSERTTRIFIKSPKRKWLWRGGAAASALPVFAACLFLYVGSGFIAPHFLLGTLIFIGTMITLGISTPYIIHKNKSGFLGVWAFVVIGQVSATLAHIILIILFFIYWEVSWGGVGAGHMFASFISANLMLWGVVTLPTSALCGWIFWFVAVRRPKLLMPSEDEA